MAKTIIIPSDFSQQSLLIAENILRKTDQPVRIIFTHLFHLATDIQDLLFSTYRKKEYEFVSDKFSQECELLKNFYPTLLEEIKVEFYYGNTLASFKNFLDHHQAEAIAYSESYGVPLISKSSISALPVVRKSGLPLINTDMISEPAYLENRV